MPPERTERRPLGRLPARIVGRQARRGHLLSLGLFNQIGETAMTSDMEIAFNEQGIPNTFVPGRNLVFLTAAAALAWRKGIRHLVMASAKPIFPAIPTAATTPSRPCRSPSTSAWTPVSSCIPP